MLFIHRHVISCACVLNNKRLTSILYSFLSNSIQYVNAIVDETIHKILKSKNIDSIRFKSLFYCQLKTKS